MTNEEYKAHSEEKDPTVEEMTDEDITDEDEMTDENDMTDEEEMTDEEMTFIMELQIAVVSFLFGMAFMGILVYVTTPALKFFI